MALRNLSDLEFLDILKAYNKSYFTVADFVKIFNISGNSSSVTISRLYKKGLINKIFYNVYVIRGIPINIDAIISELFYPSYISFESALFRYGILSQAPFTLTFAWKRRSKKINIAGNEVVLRKIKPELFFGFSNVAGVNIATPEKALMDMIYYQSKGLSNINFDELSILNINKDKFIKISKSYPKILSGIVDEVTRSIGSNKVSV